MRAIALYDFQGDESSLNFQAGTIIEVDEQEDSGWWKGHVGLDNGWFPASYVEEMDADYSIWEEYYTEDQEKYYVNRITGESAWTIPESPVSDKDCKSPSSRLSLYMGDSPSPPPSDPIFMDPFSSSGPFSSHVLPPKQSLSGPRLSFSRTSRSPTIVSTKPVPAVAVEENGRFGYSNNFWSDKGGKSGFDILVLKHRNGKEVCKDIAHVMAERVRIEEAYSKALMDLANSNLGNLEGGTARTAWNQLKFDLQTQAKSRLEFSKTLHTDVETKIMNFKNDQKKTRKNYEATIAADRRVLLIKHQNCAKMHKIYFNKCKEADIAEALVVRAQHDNNLSKKDLAKLEDNARKEKKKASIAAHDYKSAINEYEMIRLQWEEDMEAACREFQAAEEDRIDFIRSVLQTYLDIQKKVNESCKESSEMVESSINAVSKEVDIEMFVKTHFTGSIRPAPTEFVPYKDYI